jgi:peptidoglycan hydrolase-like protein with peptidoglycan-binding domain
MMTLALPRLNFTASPNYSSRGGQRVRLIVVHDCEGTYEGSISWFAQARSQVSAHIVLSEDGTQATQMVAWANKAWHACSFNPFSEGIEAAGFAAKGFSASEWDALAAIVAFRLHENGLPCRWAEKGIGEGFCSHYDLGAAGGGHKDPTTDQGVWDAFVARVAAAYVAPQPDVWRPDIAPAPVPAAPPGFIPSPDPRHDFHPPSLEWVQAALNRLGIPHVPLIVDGIEGRATRSAIVDFQERARVFIDGEAGKDTCAALEKALGERDPPRGRSSRAKSQGQSK